LAKGEQKEDGSAHAIQFRHLTIDQFDLYYAVQQPIDFLACGQIKVIVESGPVSSVCLYNRSRRR